MRLQVNGEEWQLFVHHYEAPPRKRRYHHETEVFIFGPHGERYSGLARAAKADPAAGIFKADHFDKRKGTEIAIGRALDSDPIKDAFLAAWKARRRAGFDKPVDNVNVLEFGFYDGPNRVVVRAERLPDDPVTGWSIRVDKVIDPKGRDIKDWLFGTAASADIRDRAIELAFSRAEQAQGTHGSVRK